MEYQQHEELKVIEGNPLISNLVEEIDITYCQNS